MLTPCVLRDDTHAVASLANGPRRDATDGGHSGWRGLRERGRGAGERRGGDERLERGTRLTPGASRVECQVASGRRGTAGPAARLESRCRLQLYHANRVSAPDTGRTAHHKGITRCRVNLIPVTEHLKSTLFCKRLFGEQLLQHNFAFALNKSQCHLYSFTRSCILSA